MSIDERISLIGLISFYGDIRGSVSDLPVTGLYMYGPCSNSGEIYSLGI